MMRFGIIGRSLSHSFSKSYFEKKFKGLNLKDHTFENFELSRISEFKELLIINPALKGLSVTIPYKEEIIPFLDDLSIEAKAIGAVNCVNFEGGKSVGHNTDVYGFSQSIKPFLDTHHGRALILGTGGASKAVAYALRKVGVEVYFVSTSSKKNDHTFAYSEINELVLNAFKLIVNTTPLGTYPGIEECPPLPFQHFTPQHLAYDLIYNPEQTLFLKRAHERGAITVNGLSMLHLQAEKNWEIWNAK